MRKQSRTQKVAWYVANLCSTAISQLKGDTESRFKLHAAAKEDNNYDINRASKLHTALEKNSIMRRVRGIFNFLASLKHLASSA